jgi:TetR/AcrR family tetracycline transcriptional repressor
VISTKSATGVELSRAAIVEKALEIIDREGLDAVTIRRIAQEFGVTPMALYWHVPNKEELLNAVGDSFFTGMTPPEPVGSWTQRLRAVVDMLVERLKAHPGAASLAMPRILSAPEGRDVSEFTVGLLRDAGFGVTQSADLARMGLQTAIMLATQFPGAESQAARDERAEIIAEKRAAIKALPVDRYPHLVEAADALTDCEDQKAYNGFGIDMYIEGVRAMHRQRRRT